MPNSVRVYSSYDTSAPSLTYAAGGILTVLDNCLVSGYGSVTLTSLVISGNVASATVSGGHGFTAAGSSILGYGRTLPVITIAGATPAGLNGEWRIASIPDSTTFTFATVGISDQTATGTITAKRASAGWTKPYTGTNKAAFRNNSTSGTGAYLRVDDSATYESRVIGYESMSGIDTGTGGFYTNGGSGAYWQKAYNGATSARPWILIANNRIFYLFIYWGAWDGHMVHCFGDIVSYKSSDAYRVLISGDTVSTYTSAGIKSKVFLNQSSTVYAYMARTYTGLGSAVAVKMKLPNMRAIVDNLSGQLGMPFPNPADNSLILHYPCTVYESNTVAFRGHMPGLVYSPQTIQRFLTGGYHPGFLWDTPIMDNRELIIIGVHGGSQTDMGTGFVDITGPWES